MSKQPVLTLTQLHLDRLPGIDQAFSVSAEPGVNLVVGPNEAGKSSLARTVFELLWPTAAVITPFAARGEFVDEVGPLHAKRHGSEPVLWTRQGEDAQAPTLPGGHVAHCYRLGLLDLNRRDAGDLDQKLAREVQRQMAGGYDLSLVRDLFPDHGRRLSGHTREWSQARQDLQQCQNKQKQLSEQERELESQEDEKKRVLLASRRADQLAAALTHHELSQSLAELAGQLTELPPDMAQVRTDDHKILADLQQRMADKSHQIQELQDRIQQQNERLARITVTGDLDQLEAVVTRTAELSALAEESGRAEAAAAAAAADARADLAPELLQAEIPAGSEKAFTLLAQAHRDLAAQSARLEHLDHLLEMTVERESSGDEVLAISADAVAVLASGRLTPPGRIGLVGGSLGLLAAMLMVLLGSNQADDAIMANRMLSAALAIGLVGAGALGQWFYHRWTQQQAQRELEKHCRQAEHPLPAGWSTADAVTEFMRHSELVGQQGAGRQVRTVLHTELERQRDAAQKIVDEAAERRRKLMHDLGQDEHRETPGLLHDLDRVARCRVAENNLEASQGVHRHNRDALATAVSDSQQRLAGMDVTVGETALDLQVGLGKLRARQTETTSLLEVQAGSEAALSQAVHERGLEVKNRAGLLARLVVSVTGDETDTAVLDLVVAKVSALPTYEELTKASESTQRDLRRIEGDLASDDQLPPAAEVLALSREDLAERLAEERQLAAGAEGLVEDIARTKERIESARRGDEWELARAHDTEKAADLGDLLDRQRLSELGNLLLDTIETRHENDTQPPLLKEMNEHLKLFTGGRFQLRVTGDGDQQRFEAIDPAQNRLPLTALSDGTRAQLLLAARLAFLGLSEDGLRAPLFMDEALTASDPMRFDAIAGAVGELAASTGRQVFYLTSNPADLAAWQRALANKNLPVAHEIDLAMQRALPGAATAQELELPALPSVPLPNGRSAAEYGAQLQVPSLKPWAHENEVHLFHLWKDDLELVYRLLVGGLPTLGQWRRLGAELVHAGMINTDRAAHIDARGEVFGAFLDVWRVGRGRPLTRDDLGQSGALSAAMLLMGVELLEKVNGDATHFIAGVHDGKIKRLNRDKKEALQDFLEREGHLDSRAVWQPDQIVAHVLGTVSEPLAAGVLTADEVRRLVLDLHRVAG